MAEKNIGKITQIIGAVLDIKYADGRFRRLMKRLRSQDRITLDLWWRLHSIWEMMW